MNTLPKKRSVSIGDRTVEYIASGAGSPVIVLINGAGGPVEGWFRVFSELAKLTAVFAYNRAGIGKSSKPAEPQSGMVLVETLRATLQKAEISPPYILVAHSLGGLIANLFARLFPTEVAGVVFLEAAAPEDVAAMAAYERPLQKLLRQLIERVRGTNNLDETVQAHQTVAHIESAPSFPNIPVVVITGGKPALAWLAPAQALAARAEHQRRLSRISPRGKQIIASRSGHFPQFSEPELVVDVVRDVMHSTKLLGA